MNQTELIEIAVKCGAHEMFQNDFLTLSKSGLEAFTQEIRNRTIDECDEVCDDRANKCALKADDADDIDDEIELKYNALQFKVLATAIRKLKSEVTK